MNAPLHGLRGGLRTIDLFCGAGGWSEGLKQACNELDLPIQSHVCVNHDSFAISTHKANHPYAYHVQDSTDIVSPAEFGQRDIVIASPSCTHFSNARGAAPIHDQLRTPAGSVPSWIKRARPAFFCIENVKEFLDWGPLLKRAYKGKKKGTPDPRKKGKDFQEQIVQPIRALGYSVEWRILTCADYGDPTTRKRLFIVGRRDGKPVEWPEPTHQKGSTWVPARSIINFNNPTKLLRDRPKQLVPNTLKRIEAGIRKYWGPYAEQFLVVLRGTSDRQIQASPP